MLPLLHSPRAFESVLCFTAHMTATYTSLRLTLEPQGYVSGLHMLHALQMLPLEQV